MKKADPEYASVLMDHLRRDCDRFRQGAEWAPIVLWMAEEVRRQAAMLNLPSDISREMADMASRAQMLVCRA